MFNKKVTISDDGLLIRKSKILWENIVGLREHNNPIYEKISSRFPMSEIFIKGGRVFLISNDNVFVNNISLKQEEIRNDYDYVIETIKNKAPCAVESSKVVLEWRLLLPVVLFEAVIVLLYAVLNKTFEEISYAAILVGIVGVVVGWVWERRYRKRRYS